MEQLIRFLNKNNEVFDVLLQFWEDLVESVEAHQQRQVLAPQIYTILGEVYDSVCKNTKYSLALIKELNSKAEHKIGDRSQ